MKNIVFLLLIVSLFGCLSTSESFKNSDIESINVVEESRLLRDGNRKLTEADELLLKQLRDFALTSSDVVAYSNANVLSSLRIEEDPQEAYDSAKDIFDGSWNINSKHDFLNSLNRRYFTGIRTRYINVLENILRKKELVHNPELLTERSTWQDDLDSGILSEDDFFDINFLIYNGNFISYKDIVLFELERISSFIKWGFALNYLTEEECNILLEDLALEILSYDYNWNKWGNSYVSGIAFLFNDSRNLNKSIRNRSMKCLTLMNNFTWQEDNWDAIRNIATGLTERKILKTPTYFNYGLKISESPDIEDIHSSIIELFTEERDSANLLDSYVLDFALYQSIQNSDYEKVKYLLENNEIPDIQTQNGVSYITESVGKDIRIMGLLLEAGYNPDLQNTGNKRVALHYAVDKKQYEHIKLLLWHGANPNIMGKYDKTPLGFAINIQDEQAVDLLLEAGANPDMGLYSQYSTLGLAIKGDNESIAIKCIEKSNNIDSYAVDDWTNLHLASIYRSNDVIKALMLKEADVNVLTNSGYSPLSFSILYDGSDMIEKVKTLIVNGSDKSHITEDGLTPLLLYLGKTAADEIFSPHFNYFLDITEDKTKNVAEELSIPLLLSFYGSKDQINYYLDQVPNYKLDGQQGCYTLISLAERGFVQEFKRVIEISSDLNYIDEDGITLLSGLKEISADWAVDILSELD